MTSAGGADLAVRVASLRGCTTETIEPMAVSPKDSPSIQACPFCGVATEVAHETQEGCIAALHGEIGRMRGILSTLRPAGAVPAPDVDPQTPAKVRLILD